MQDGKVGCNTVEYSTAFLYCYWLYFYGGMVENVRGNEQSMGFCKFHFIFAT